jgi:hypothetical protein
MHDMVITIKMNIVMKRELYPGMIHFWDKL